MGKTSSARVPTRITTLAILEILKTHSNYANPITNTYIRQILLEKYEIKTSKESVKSILDDLENYFPPPEKIVAIHREENSRNATGYYYEIPEEPGINGTIKRIRAAIANNLHLTGKEKVLSFQFCGVNKEGDLVPAGSHCDYQDMLPLKVCWSQGHPYLVCLSSKEDTYPMHFRLDLMRNVYDYLHKKPQNEKRSRTIHAITSISDEEYVFCHPFMAYETENQHHQHIRFRIKKIKNKPQAGYNLLKDVFGHWENIGEDKDSIYVEVNTLPFAAEQFVFIYRDRVSMEGKE